jgi:hypothetical protein
MLNFDDRDLLRKARAAGFAALELDYRAEVEVPEPLPTSDWEVLKTAPNPLVPTFEEAPTQTLTGQERDRFENHMLAIVRAPAGLSPPCTSAPSDPHGSPCSGADQQGRRSRTAAPPGRVHPHPPRCARSSA